LEITKDCSCLATGGFPITVTGNNPQPSSLSIPRGQTQSVTLGPGSFTVTESQTGFATTFTGDCTQTAPGSFEATGTISAGQTLHCTVINFDGTG
jgi:hypothetical protein